MSSENSIISSVNDAEVQTFALETYARRSRNYLTRMLDESGQPYFNVFWTEPAEAAHDWPDFGHVTSRQLQAAMRWVLDNRNVSLVLTGTKNSREAEDCIAAVKAPSYTAEELARAERVHHKDFQAA